MKKAFTLVELLIVIAIIGVLAALVVTNLGGCNINYSQETEETNDYYCVKTYVITTDETSSKRVVVSKSSDGSDPKIFLCDDSLYPAVYNSDLLYAKIQEGKWYRIRTRGLFNQAGVFKTYPLIIEVEDIREKNY